LTTEPETPDSWVQILAMRRREIDEGNAAFGEPPLSDEHALRQIVYEAIAHFIEREDYRLGRDWLNPEWDFENAVNEWIDVQTPETFGTDGDAPEPNDDVTAVPAEPGKDEIAFLRSIGRLP
jgi:hypothetical protein